MPSARDANSVDPRGKQEPSLPTESRAPSAHPGSKERNAANDLEKGNGEEAHTGAGTLRSLLSKFTRGAQKHEKSSTHETATSKTSELPGDKAESPKDGAAEGPTAEVEQDSELQDSGKESSTRRKTDEHSEEQPETKTPTENNVGMPPRDRGKRPVGDQQGATEAPPASDAPRKLHAKEGRPEEGSAIGSEGTQREYKNASHSNINNSAPRSIRSDTQGPSPEPVEIRCERCGDLIYINLKTGQLCDPQPPMKPEICYICRQPWPDGKPFSEAMIIRIKQRLEDSRERYKDILRGKYVLCERCAAEAQRDVNEQVEARGLDDDDYYKDGHLCKETDFERDKKNVEPESFPDDPNRPKGKKRALLIGINYSAQEKELKGCRNDAKNMYSYLKSNAYKDKDIDILMDVKPYSPPTMRNIVNHMKRLVKGARAGESLFFHYSGHGGQTEDKGNKDELDGKDECIYPVDYRRTHPWTKLIDDDMHNILTDIPKGVHLTAIFDSCHSGSVLDLPYVLTSGTAVQKVDPRKPKKVREKEVGRVILWSGCDDRQTSADTKIDGVSVGAMSHAFITANQELLQEKRKESSDPAVDYTYEELLVKIERILREKFSQKPQLSSNQLLDPKKHKVYV